MFSGDSRHLFVTEFGEPIALDLAEGRALDSARWRALKLRPSAFSADASRVAAQEKRQITVHDIVTGEPLTPRLQADSELYFGALMFSPDGRLVLAAAGDHAQLWPLPTEDRPVQELVLLAQLLSGRQIDDSGSLAPWRSKEANAEWQALRATYPDRSASTPSQTRAWREQIADKAAAERNWFTAAFYLDQLLKDYPSDESLRRRRARVRNQAEDSQ